MGKTAGFVVFVECKTYQEFSVCKFFLKQREHLRKFGTLLQGRHKKTGCKWSFGITTYKWPYILL